LSSGKYSRTVDKFSRNENAKVDVWNDCIEDKCIRGSVGVEPIV